jgi:hypothetical protein
MSADDVTKLRITSVLTIGHEDERLLIAGDLDRFISAAASDTIS